MKTTKKALLTVLCALLLVVASVMGTLAYLQDSESVTNTFTVGNVDIMLDEADLSTPAADDRTEDGNSYKIYPGQTYTKDPTVTVLEGSDESYVRMIVTITDLADVKAVFGTDPTTNYFLPQYFVQGWDPTVWVTTNVVDEDVVNNTATYEFRYFETVDATDGKLDALFDSFKIPETVTNEQIAKLADMKIMVEAHAIQAEGFDTADLAWAKFTK